MLNLGKFGSQEEMFLEAYASSLPTELWGQFGPFEVVWERETFPRKPGISPPPFYLSAGGLWVLGGFRAIIHRASLLTLSGGT